MYHRSMFKTLVSRLKEERRFIQVLAGPRQTGKTTIARQAMVSIALPSHYASADDPALKGAGWLEQQWDLARLKMESDSGAVLFLDEIHKLPRWAETTKRLWDADTADNAPLHVVLLGSSPLLLHEGLSESLGGRFENIRVPHWSLKEMSEAFGYSRDEFIVFGGYPGAASLRMDFPRWRSYILDALVETSISRDVLLMARVDKPALLRRTFELACAHSGRILSFQKMVGQLQDAGNTTTVAHYLQLLGAAGLVAGIQKFTGEEIRRRASSPKLQVLNTALMTAQTGRGLDEARNDRDYWGHLVESAVGAHLLNHAWPGRYRVFYWRHRNLEVDYVLASATRTTALEVKSGRAPDSFPGIEAFRKRFKPDRVLLVGAEGITIEDFLSTTPAGWLE